MLVYHAAWPGSQADWPAIIRLAKEKVISEQVVSRQYPPMVLHRAASTPLHSWPSRSSPPAVQAA